MRPLLLGSRYAWIVVATLTFLLAISHGLITSGISVFDAEILKDLGIGRGDLKFRDFLQLFAAGIWALLIGYTAERIGPRTIIYVGLVVLAGVLLGYGYVTNVYQIYGLHLLLAFAYSSCHVVIVILIITRWFYTRKSAALGIILAGESLGGTVFPQIVVRLLEQYDWRTAMQVLSAVPLLLSLVLLLLLRRTPEDHGHPRFGEGEVRPPEKRMPDAALGPDARFRDYLLQPTTFLLLLAAVCLFYAGGGFVAHAFLYFRDSGLPASAAATSLSLIFITAFAGKLGGGLLADRLGPHSCWLVFQGLLLAGALVLALGSGPIIWAGIVLLGLGWGGCYTVTQSIITELFAGPWLGRLSGMSVLMEGCAAGLGVWLTGVLYDQAGSYAGPFTFSAALVVVSIAASTIIARRRRNAVRTRPAEPVAHGA
ncbi:MFS transporter [Luteimonas composti]|uniref:MFS transporter n=1 Tax=Luteimonas composti TaxID=398257 RepID=A0ABT6MNR0_9GAMM|nr:MFS transporter [Luteimonas composti]MDH7452221.1 MFS transporter [Luteimonas composti]